MGKPRSWSVSWSYEQMPPKPRHSTVPSPLQWTTLAEPSHESSPSKCCLCQALCHSQGEKEQTHWVTASLLSVVGEGFLLSPPPPQSSKRQSPDQVHPTAASLHGPTPEALPHLQERGSQPGALKAILPGGAPAIVPRCVSWDSYRVTGKPLSRQKS